MMESESRNTDYLDEFLKMDPGYLLSEDFAEKVVFRVQRKKETNRFFREFFIYLGIFIIPLAALIGAGYFMKLESFNRLMNIIPGNLSWIAGLVLIGLFILFVDKVLLPYFFMIRSSEK